MLLAVSPPTVPSHGAQRGSARCVRGPLLAGRNSAFTNWFAKNHLFSFETFQVVKITHMEIRFKSYLLSPLALSTQLPDPQRRGRCVSGLTCPPPPRGTRRPTSPGSQGETYSITAPGNLHQGFDSFVSENSPFTSENL